MGQTVIPFGDPKAQKKWAATLFSDTIKKSYFERFTGTGENSIIQRKTELDSSAGDRISFDLSVQLRERPTSGDNRLMGKEENLKFFTDEIIIDQLRKSVSAGGKMTQKRTSHNLRQTAKDRLSDYWSQYIDELYFIYLSGARGMNQGFLEPVGYAGHAGNPLRAPDAQHLMFGGDATSKATITADDKMTKDLVERAVVKAEMLKEVDPNNINMVPVSVESGKHFVMLMSPFQAHDMRVADKEGWMDVVKALTTAEGKSSPIFKGGLGMINDCVLHSHRSTTRFNDYGTGSNVQAARALFMGRQAGVVAYGTSGGLRFSWKEETADYGNENTVAAGTIIGISKTRFNKRDFGVISIDTAAADPNA